MLAAEAGPATEVGIEAAVSAEVEAAHSVVVKVEDVCLVAGEVSASAQRRYCIVAVVRLASVALDSLSCTSHPKNVFCDYAIVAVGVANVSGDLVRLTGRCDIAVLPKRRLLLLCAASPSCSARACE